LAGTQFVETANLIVKSHMNAIDACGAARRPAAAA
jgi:hypothetical protein